MTEDKLKKINEKHREISVVKDIKAEASQNGFRYLSLPVGTNLYTKQSEDFRALIDELNKEVKDRIAKFATVRLKEVIKEFGDM